MVARPDDPEAMVDETRFAEDEFLPYWAELWPSGLALARHVAGTALGGKRVLELGCGLALPSFAAALAGADVTATDWAPEAVDLAAANAAANRLSMSVAVLDWASPRSTGLPPFDLVVAADVLYEERNAAPLLRLLHASVARDGQALIADPGRRHAPAFFELAGKAGWSIDHVAVGTLPAGGIARLRRDGPGHGRATLCGVKRRFAQHLRGADREAVDDSPQHRGVR